jgi:hypothetical protein
MRTVVFFLFLCFLLLKGYDYASAGVHHAGPHYSSAHYIEKSNQVKFESTNQKFPVIISHSLSEKKEELISLENEDEDLSFTRKYVLADCILALIFAWFLLFPGTYLKKRLPFCWHLSYTSSYKYILERALRI